MVFWWFWKWIYTCATSNVVCRLFDSVLELCFSKLSLAIVSFWQVLSTSVSCLPMKLEWYSREPKVEFSTSCEFVYVTWLVNSYWFLNMSSNELRFCICSKSDSIIWWKTVAFFACFFSIRVFFRGYWQLTGQQGKGVDLLLFHSTTSTRSRTFRHLFATLHVRWLSHIFNRTACIYQTVTRYSNYHLIDWWCDIKFLFVYVMIWF